MNDLFGAAAPRRSKPAPANGKPGGRNGTPDETGYTAASIEVLEGLEPVRRRPGMYIGGTDSSALHHLFAEVIDNAMDEAVAGHANRIEVQLEANGFLSVTDNGRGIPVDPHPKFRSKSALEVIMTTLHSGGKFDSKVYTTSGGLHGVGVSVVNALSETLTVEVARGQQLYRMAFARGVPQGRLQKLGPVKNRRGTTVRFKPDEKIFGKGATFQPRARIPHGPLEGISVWRCRDPLGLRARPDPRCDAGGGDVPFPGRAQGVPRGHHRGAGARHQGHLRRARRACRWSWFGRVGRVLDRRRGWVSQLLLQHHPDQ